jgi:uncharacterized protein YegP (UPF0339 family)
MPGKFELKASTNGQFMFNLKATNGQVILTSELYKGKDDAMDGIASVRKHAASDANFERKTSKNDEPFFSLKSSNGRIIGKSETYSSAAAMENGVASVMANAPDAKLDDLTTQ